MTQEELETNPLYLAGQIRAEKGDMELHDKLIMMATKPKEELNVLSVEMTKQQRINAIQAKLQKDRTDA